MNRQPTILIAVLLLTVLLGACGGEVKQDTFKPPDRDQIIGSDTGNGETDNNIHCTDPDPHPMGESIAKKFEVSYEQVMTWYCGGDAFSDILLALETAKLVEDQEVEILLERLENQNWDEIWTDLGVSPE
jgi:hypothetical protein